MRSILKSAFAVLVLTFTFPVLSISGNVPPEQSEGKIPAPAVKGIDKANEVVEKAVEHRKPTPPKPSLAETFYKGPLSSVNESKSGSDKNNGKEAVSKLAEVQAKLEDKVPKKSKAPEKIAAAKEKIAEHVTSKNDDVGQTGDIPSDKAKVPDEGHKGLDRAKAAKENQGVSKDHRKDAEHRSDISVKLDSSVVKTDKKEQAGELKRAKKKKTYDQLKIPKAKLAAKLPPKAQAV